VLFHFFQQRAAHADSSGALPPRRLYAMAIGRAPASLSVTGDDCRAACGM